MPRNVNPFEPWRPPQAAEKPPEIDPHKPWRPEGAAEPAPTAKPAPAPAPPPRRQAPPPPAPTRHPPAPARPPLRPDQVAARTVLCLLVIGGVIGTAIVGGNHLPRVLAACLALGLGWSAGVSWARRRSTVVRLGWVVLGVAGALAARWFMPATDGVSLWGASHTAAALEALPADEIGTFAAGTVRRQAIAGDFPEYTADIVEAESAWLRRCVDTAVGEAEYLQATEPAQASARLRGTEIALTRLPQAGFAAKEVREARRRTLDVRTKRARAELELLADHGQFKEVAETASRRLDEMNSEVHELNVADEVRQELAPPRARAVHARLEAARAEVKTLLKEDRYQAVATLGENLARSLADEAEAAGCAVELKKFCDSCRVLGDLARQAGKKD